jgi:pimeloyl-ACP methyl ester carboxylesterase
MFWRVNRLRRFGLPRRVAHGVIGGSDAPAASGPRQGSASYDATGRLGDIRVPALILHGRRDKSTPVDPAEQMHAGIPGSRVELFRGRHMFFLFAERQQFLGQAGRFLAE